MSTNMENTFFSVAVFNNNMEIFNADAGFRLMLVNASEQVHAAMREVIRLCSENQQIETTSTYCEFTVGEEHFQMFFYPTHAGDTLTGTGIVCKATAEPDQKETTNEGAMQHQLLFENINHGIVYQRADGYIISANKAAQKILGLTISQMQGRTSIDPRWESIHEDGRPFPGSEHPAMQALQTGKQINNVIMGVFNPLYNEHRWIRITAIPKFNAGQSRPFIVFSIFEDISVQRQAEAEIILSLRKDITLKQQQTRFIQMASHQFRTPLAGIKSNTDLLEMLVETGSCADKDLLNRCFARINSEIEQLQTILTNISHANKIDKYEQPFEPQCVKIDDLCHSLAKDKRWNHQDNNVIHIHCEGVVPMVLVDPETFTEAISNIISNAFKYSDNDVDLKILATPNAIQISIIDTGIGIAATDMNNLYSPFFRASNTGGVQGNGLGLFIAKKDLEINKCSIQMQSEINKGTTVTITVPDLVFCAGSKFDAK